MSDRAVGRACERIAAWASGRRRLVIGLVVVATAASVLLMGRLSISGALGDAIGEASPAARAISTIGARFDVGEDLLVLASVDEAIAPGVRRERLASFGERLARAIDADPRARGLVRAVSWHRDDSAQAWVDEVGVPGAPFVLDDEGFATLLERLGEQGIEERVRRVEALVAAPGPLAQGAAAEAIADPLDVRGLLVESMRRRAGGMEISAGESLELSRDGRSLLIRVSGASGPDDLEASKRLVAIVREAAARAGDGDVRVELGGAPAIAAYAASSIRSDLIRSVIGAVVAVQALFLVVYRGGAAFLVVTLPAGLGIVWAFGAEGLWAGRLTALGAAIGAILVGLGVDYAVHAASGVDARDGADAGTRAIGRVGAGIVGAAVTTIIAFGALATSRLEILHGFAAIGAMGLAGAMLATIVLMPILIRRGIGPRRFVALSGVASPRGASAAVAASALLGCVCLVAIVLGATGPAGLAGLVPLDDSLDAMHPSPSPALEAQRRIDRAFASAGDGLPVLVEAEDDASLVRRVHDVACTLASDAARASGVRGVVGLDALVAERGVVSDRREALAGVDPDAVRTAFRDAMEDGLLAPDALDGAAERLAAMVRSATVPTVEDVRARTGLARSLLPVDGRDPPAAVSYVLLDRSMDRRSDRAEVVGAISGLLREVPGATLTGLPVLGEEAERLAIGEAPRLLGVALAGVLVWLGMYFRRVGDVLLALVPGLFAFVVLAALLGPLGVRLNIVSMAAFPLLVGIGVDDGIFLVSAARDARSAPDPGEAMRRRFGEVAHALVTTSLTTVLAFGSLVLTSTPAIRSLGLLVGIGVLACLWGSLLLLAPMLLLGSGRRAVRVRRAAA